MKPFNFIEAFVKRSSSRRRRRERVMPRVAEYLEQRRLLTAVASVTPVVSLPQISVDDAFEIEVFAQDLRTTGPGTGLLAAAADVVIDSSILRIDSITHTMNDATGGNILPGEVDEFVGVEFSGPAARTSQKVGSIFVTAIATGNTTISTNPGEALQSEIVLHGVDGDQRDNTQFNNLSLRILPAGALEIDLDIGESLLVRDSDGSVEVVRNGVRDEAVNLPSVEVTSITVTLGGSNHVDLGGVSPGDFGNGQAVSVVINGSSTGDSVIGSGFADRISGRGGADTLIGGAGDDTLWGGWGRDKLEGQSGNDTLIGNAGHDTLFGGGGDDFLKGMAGRDSIYGDNGDDTLRGSAGHDLIDGGTGNDLLFGNGGRDTLTGNAGNDSLIGGWGRDHIQEEAANEFMLTNSMLTGNGTEQLHRIEKTERTGGNPHNVINAASFSGQAWLHEEAGDDTLIGGIAADFPGTGIGSDVARGHEGDETLVGSFETNDRIGGDSDDVRLPTRNGRLKRSLDG